jgi:hypothetical protein
MYATHTLSAGSPHIWQPFASHQQRWTEPTAPEKKGSLYNPSTSADRSVALPPSFSPKTTIQVVMKAKHLLTTGYIGLLDS